MPSTIRGRVRRALPVAALTLALPLTQSLAAAATDGSGVATTAGSAAATSLTAVDTAPSRLPFDIPTTTLRASSKKVFAHYMPNLPISMDNKAPSTDYYTRNYLNPDGESGKHAAYGGFMRDRPLTRDPLTDTAWRLRDLETEVRQAGSAGLDGFAVDLLQLGDTGGQLWTNTKTLLQAAHNADPGFRILLMPDMASNVGSKDAATLAKSVAELGKSPAAHRLADGRLVVSPFMAEKKTVAWWTTFLNTMKTTYSTTVAFWPVFVASEQTYAASFAPISYGMSSWGSRNPAWNNPTTTIATGPLGRATKIHALGQKWMQPVSVQDERPASAIYDEAENTTNLRNTWAIARGSAAEQVQVPTWNDYTEGTQLAPSGQHGWTYLDISSYYLTWYKTGTAPVIKRDAVYLTHRKQPYAAKPSYAQTKLMALRGGSPARNTVEALTFLTAPAKVAVTVGSTTTTCDVPAGVATCLAPLAAGTVKVSVTRSGSAVAAVTSPHKVTTTPYVQDLGYVGVGSLRDGTGATTPSPTSGGTTTPTPTPTTPTPTPTTPTTPIVQTVSPAADAYGNEAAAATAYGSTPYLYSKGTPGAASYLRFALPAAPAGKTLTKAVLRVRTTDDPSAGSVDTHPVRVVTGAWDEAAMTWTSRPTTYGASLGTITGATALNSVYDTVLDAAALRALAGTTATVAVTGSGSDSLWFWSREQADPTFRPQLTLTYE